MKPLTMVFFLVAVSTTMIVLIGEMPGAMAANCNYMELVPCADALTSSNKPSGACCSKIREQRSCVCGYLRNPTLRQFVSPATAKRIASQCGVTLPQC
ncbi:hypothetical protein SSX86_009966 [Deinandra increscens subsp. villosa]|uniref:Bifunctional inhibitor/plant lipid transfer protein/seed storage helical domain-containing protein n=1 Tax=Deinandra increscens subsp. villosa TaxID=3103831 RepID=A0AAP0H4J5_9ASTR